jgi:hypothetical protein
MRRSRFHEVQIVAALRQAEHGIAVGAPRRPVNTHVSHRSNGTGHTNVVEE